MYIFIVIFRILISTIRNSVIPIHHWFGTVAPSSASLLHLMIGGLYLRVGEAETHTENKHYFPCLVSIGKKSVCVRMYTR